jgi:glycosyltransferase involved in cell wall biosynthesis
MIAFFKSDRTAQSDESWQKTVSFFSELDGASLLHVARIQSQRWGQQTKVTTALAGAFNRHLAMTRATAILRELPKRSICWCVGTPFQSIRFEQRIKRSGMFYVFNLLDDWLSIPALREGALQRIALADLVAVPTQELKSAILSESPKARVEVFEEVVDVEAFTPFEAGQTDPKRVVWNGRKSNVHHLQQIYSALTSAHMQVPFELLVYGDSRWPDIMLPIPYQWMPFSREGESRALSGCRAGLDPLGNSRYEQCKGNYKVKVYLAGGVPVVASAVGINNRLIDNGSNGFLATSDDDWSEAIVRLVREESLYKAMSAAARAYAVSGLSHRAILPQWYQTLQECGFMKS